MYTTVEAAEPVKLYSRNGFHGMWVMPARTLTAAGGKIAMKREMNTVLAPRRRKNCLAQRTRARVRCSQRIFSKPPCFSRRPNQKAQMPPMKQAAVPAAMGCHSGRSARPRMNPAPRKIASPGSGMPMLFRNTAMNTSTKP